jgi:hypothetical protein
MAMATGISTHVMVLKSFPIFSQEVLLFWLCMAVSRMCTSVEQGFLGWGEKAMLQVQDVCRQQVI